MKDIFSAVWRFATNQCAGGEKATAIAVKLALLMLFGGVGGVVWAAPHVYAEYQDFQITLSGFKDSITQVSHAMEIQAVRAAGRDDAQDYRLARMQSDIDEAQRHISQSERDVLVLRGEVRRLDEVTIKRGRP